MLYASSSFIDVSFATIVKLKFQSKRFCTVTLCLKLNYRFFPCRPTGEILEQIGPRHFLPGGAPTYATDRDVSRGCSCRIALPQCVGLPACLVDGSASLRLIHGIAGSDTVFESQAQKHYFLVADQALESYFRVARSGLGGLSRGAAAESRALQ